MAYSIMRMFHVQGTEENNRRTVTRTRRVHCWAGVISRDRLSSSGHPKVFNIAHLPGTRTARTSRLRVWNCPPSVNAWGTHRRM